MPHHVIVCSSGPWTILAEASQQLAVAAATGPLPLHLAVVTPLPRSEQLAPTGYWPHTVVTLVRMSMTITLPLVMLLAQAYTVLVPMVVLELRLRTYILYSLLGNGGTFRLMEPLVKHILGL